MELDMELQGVKLIIKNYYDFFSDNFIESFIANIPYQKETHISELNKFAVVKFEQDNQKVLLFFNGNNIQLEIQTLEGLYLILEILEMLEEKAEKALNIESINFTGAIETDSHTDTYNPSFSNEFPASIKVKMLGIDIENEKFNYRISLNKHHKSTKVTAKVLLKSSLKIIEKQAMEAFEELREYLKKLQKTLERS